jgi:tRNA A37 threonylcarbamoyladenosine dehydratase
MLLICKKVEMNNGQNVAVIPDWKVRTELLMGTDAIQKLAASHVLVVGLGGVGGYSAEMLVRAGIGEITIVDGDKINASNRNRQLIALKSNEGKYKTDLFEERLMDINPDLKLTKVTEFLKEDRMDWVLETGYDYVIDAIDTLSPKVYLICKSLKHSYPIISSMGSGGKFDPLKVEVKDISESYNCRLAFSIRKQLHKFDIRTGFKVVFSPEKVNKECVELVEGQQNKKSNVGTISYMPPVFGMVLSSVVIQDLAGLG